ncbi:GNAT family N-acetyltransferase [Nocardioides marmoraquaticus]
MSTAAAATSMKATTLASTQLCVLIDSNIFIALEDHSNVDDATNGPEAAELVRLIQQIRYGVLLSHGTRMDLLQVKDGDLHARRQRALDRYIVMNPVPADGVLRQVFPRRLNSNDEADLEVLSSFATGRAGWLVTEDKKLRARATRAGLENVLSLADALDMFSALAGEPALLTAPDAQHVKAYEVPLTAEVFDGLRDDYPDFAAWWRAKVVAPERPVIVLGEAAAPAGMAVLKDETEQAYGLPNRVLKLCTFKVAESHQGVKRGEALLKACIEHARAEGHHTAYVEVLPDKIELIEWLGLFGFTVLKGARAPNGQVVLVKRLAPAEDAPELDPLKYAVAYGPGNLYVERAHVVPIQGRYHQLLFPDADTARQDAAILGGAVGCGNAIRKAYLCHAPSRKVRPGHGLVFTKTRDGDARITAVGVVEQVLRSSDPAELAAAVGTRTVYSQYDIEAMCRRGEVLALSFRHDQSLDNPIAIREAVAAGVLTRTPQSIAELSPEGLQWLLPNLAA